MKINSRIRKILSLGIAVLAVLSVVGVLYYLWRRKIQLRRKPPQFMPPDISAVPAGVEGLTEDEVALRLPIFNIEDEEQEETRSFLRKSIKQNLLNPFNIDLFGIAIVMLLLDNLASALGTVAIILLNLVVNVFQEMFTRKKLIEILAKLHPQATVIRSGRIQSIDPVFIVRGDTLLIGQGDEAIVDGEGGGESQFVVERYSGAEDPCQENISPGKTLHAGDICVKGRGVYIAREDGLERHKTAPGSKLQLLLEDFTPLQRFFKKVLETLFGIVVIFSLVLVASRLLSDVVVINKQMQNAFSIIFGIAPTSLFFMLILTYATGTLRIAQVGALVYRSQSIEALASIKTLCISKESLVGSLDVTFEAVEPPSGIEPLSESLIRRFLGDILQSVPIKNDFGRMVADEIPGEIHTPVQIASRIFEEGWFGVSFDETEIRGTFVLGLPQVLDRNLIKGKSQLIGNVQDTVAQAQRGIGHWFSRFRKSDNDQKADEKQAQTNPGGQYHAEQSTDENNLQPAEVKPTWQERLRGGLEKMLNPMEEVQETVASQDDPKKDINLMFAYLPEPFPLYDRNNEPQIPNELIPLTIMHISEVVRPEAEKTIQSLVEAGLQVKIISADTPERADITARQLGLIEGEPSMVSGDDLVGISSQDFSRLVNSTTVFGNLTPSQKAAVVEALHHNNETVMMVGSKVSDVPAMRKADLRVSLKSSTQAALRLTDIVLLDDSLEPLPHILTTGQRLVKGLMDTFKLYLSQVIAQLLLILALLFTRLDHFPYNPTQAGVITAFTIAAPNIFLSVWAAAGRVSDRAVYRQLARFIIPASIFLAALAWIVYEIFMQRTGDLIYVQLTVAYALLAAGWLRVFFVQPPTPFWTGGAPLRGDKRVIPLVLVLIAAFFVILLFPLLQELLSISWLNSLADYALVVMLSILGMLSLRAIWRIRLFEPFYHWLANQVKV